jgi:hypothetical protein
MNFVCLSKETNQRKDPTSKNSKICYAPRSRANLALEILSSHRTWTAQRANEYAPFQNAKPVLFQPAVDWV